MKWKPHLGQWQTIQENAPAWRSVIQADPALAPPAAPRPRPSMFDAFKRSLPETEEAADAVDRLPIEPRPHLPQGPRPSMFSTFKPEDESRGSIWGRLFGEPVIPPSAAPRKTERELRFAPVMAGSGSRSDGFPWALGLVVLGFSALIVLDLSGTTSFFGKRSSS